MLLRAAASFSPKELVFVLDSNVRRSYDVDLPCFYGAESMELRSHRFIRLKLPKQKRATAPSVEFHALESLYLSGCSVDLAVFLPRCPRLRLLRLDVSTFLDNSFAVKIHSALLKTLDVQASGILCSGSKVTFDIEAPELKRLTVAPELKRFMCRRRLVGRTGWSLSSIGYFVFGSSSISIYTDTSRMETCLFTIPGEGIASVLLVLDPTTLFSRSSPASAAPAPPRGPQFQNIRCFSFVMLHVSHWRGIYCAKASLSNHSKNWHLVL
jgi:hypothetical protein